MYQNCDCKNDCYKIAYGNSIDLQVGDCESEIRADVTVSELESVRLWGRILNCNGDPVPNALVKLVKVTCKCNKVEYEGISHSVSDCNGFYQFELCTQEPDDCFKVIVSKAAYGPERIIYGAQGNCNPCDDSDGYPFNPCTEYESFVTPAKSCTLNCNTSKCSPNCSCKKNKHNY